MKFCLYFSKFTKNFSVSVSLRYWVFDRKAIPRLTNIPCSMIRNLVYTYYRKNILFTRITDFITCCLISKQTDLNWKVCVNIKIAILNSLSFKNFELCLFSIPILGKRYNNLILTFKKYSLTSMLSRLRSSRGMRPCGDRMSRPGRVGVDRFISCVGYSPR